MWLLERRISHKVTKENIEYGREKAVFKRALLRV
jgi:hypothetical protein